MTTPIYVGKKPVGQVVGNTFHKSVKGSKHFLHRPPAICFDVSSIKDAEEAGATEVCVYDSDSDKRYYAGISLIWEKGFTMNRGFGEQVALIMSRWRLTKEPDPEQMNLFSLAME